MSKISQTKTAMRIATFRAAGINVNADLYTNDGFLVTWHVQDQGRRRFGLQPPELITVLNRSVATEGCSVDPITGDRTIQRVAYIPAERVFVRVLISVDRRSVLTVLAPGMQTEPELERTWRSAMGDAVRAAIDDPREREWHYPEVSNDFEPARCSHLRCHTIDKVTGERIKTKLGIVPIALRGDLPDLLELSQVEVQHCLQIFNLHRKAQKLSRPGFLTLELRVWGVKKVRIFLGEMPYSDTFDELGIPFDLSFCPALVVQAGPEDEPT